jgi:benzoylformate decarboxylase
MVADLKLAAADLAAAVRSLATEGKLKQIAEERTARTRAYSSEMWELKQKMARENSDRNPVSLERLALELESSLERDACYVCDVDSGKTMDPLMSFGGGNKRYIGTSPSILGWGMAAAFGVKLARPDLPVISVVGDGSFCFSGPQPLWTQARYKAPVLNVVLNNHSYNNERNRIWHYGGRQFQTGRDMTCYLGDPDIDYAKSAQAFGVEGEVVKEPAGLKDAVARGQRAVADGRPYLLDVHTYRDGIGAVSTWHPPYSVAAQRTRKV